MKAYLSKPCAHCGKRMTYAKQYFVIRDRLWRKACRALGVSHHALMCVPCTEKGLGRGLRQGDFKPCPVTDGLFGFNLQRFPVQ